MKTSSRHGGGLLLALLATAASAYAQNPGGNAGAPVAPPPANGTWTLTALGTLGGESSRATAINDAGQVVGDADTKLQRAEPPRRWQTLTLAHAFLYSEGRMQDLGTLGGEESAAVGINNSGQIIGTADNAQYGRVFLYTGGKMQDLDDISKGFQGPLSLNNSGQVLGIGQIDGKAGYFDRAPILYSEGRMRDLFADLDIEEFHLQDVNAINDSGLIIGTVNTEPGNLFGGTTRAFVFHPEGWMEFLGFYPNAINAAGEIIGQGGDTFDHAILYSQGKEHDLGTLGEAFSSAHALNASGQVVGTYGSNSVRKSGGGFAFLYSDGRMQDLNDLVGAVGLAAVGFKVLNDATGINAKGQIVGTGTDTQGHIIAFLLTPPPGYHPASAANTGHP